MVRDRCQLFTLTFFKPFHCPQARIKTYLHKISSVLRINRSEFNFRSELFLTEFVILMLNSNELTYKFTSMQWTKIF
jgi:hypothetical protein